MKFLWDELRPLLSTIAAFSLVNNLLSLVPAFFMLQVYDRVLPSHSQETLLVLLAGAGVALLLQLALDYVRHRMQNVVGALIDERLSPSVVHALVTQHARLPHSADTAGMRDVAALRNLCASQGVIALFEAPWALVYVAVIWTFHPALGFSAALAALFMLILAWLNDRVSRRALERLQHDGRRAAQYVESSLRNAEVLQALGMTERLLARWRTLQEQVATLHLSASRSSVAFTALLHCTRQAMQIGMLGLGAYLVLNQQTSVGIMIATTVLLGRAVQPVEQVVGNWRLLVDARASYRRLRELAKDFHQGTPQLSMPRPVGGLTVEGLSYRVPGLEKPILVSLAFSLAPGEALAVIGPSAAGKSTLVRLLTGVWTPSLGAVRLDGADVAHWSRQDLGPWIGYLPQDIELFDGTVADNIARLGEVDSEAVIAAAKRANTHEMILTLAQGYDTPVGEHGTRLSPGQRQRIALARTLYGDPRLVVLDEPNSNLDGAGDVALAHTLRSLRSDGVTTVVVTHRLSLIAHVDKILVLEAGRIARFGPAREVMKALQPQAAAGSPAERVA